MLIAYCSYLNVRDVAKKYMGTISKKVSISYVHTVNILIQAHTIELGFNLYIQNDLINTTVSYPYLND